jgi:hypothetical protein
MRFFNTAGPVNCQDHYCLPPLSRFNLTEILSLIAQKKYFVLHAPRQTGKTSCFFALRDQLNQEGTYSAFYVYVEMGQTARGDVGKGMKANQYSQNLHFRQNGPWGILHIETGSPKSLQNPEKMLP